MHLWILSMEGQKLWDEEEKVSHFNISGDIQFNYIPYSSLEDPPDTYMAGNSLLCCRQCETLGWTFHQSSSICPLTNPASEPTREIHFEKRRSVWDP